MQDPVNRLIGQSYDATPYDSHPYPLTSPEHLEAVAYVFGVDAPPPSMARVLELGCASGGNLIPFAARHPQATAVGVDLSAVQVSQGVQALRHAGLSNVQLRTMDIADIDASLGQFDYIVCHGVYSWVPPSVQEAIMRVCATQLAPNGIACVSYNVYPGWKSREIVRDAMLLRGGSRASAQEQLAYARGMMEFLDRFVRPGTPIKAALDEMMPTVRQARPSYLLHEFLETCNAPCYLRDFVANAEGAGLGYLADAETAAMFVQNYGEDVREPLLRECGGSQVMMEQYLDFLVNRSFRHTLLVPAATASRVRYRLDAGRLRQLFYAGSIRSDDGAAFALDAQEQPCHALSGARFTLRLPAHKAVAQVLSEFYPAALSVDALMTAVAERLGASRAAVDGVVMTMLEELFILNAVRVRRTPVAAAASVGARPQAPSFVRSLPALALSEGPQAYACNLWHEMVELSVLERCLLPLLDGEHSAEDLVDFLVEEARAQRLRFFKHEQALTDADTLRAFAAEQVAMALRDLRQKAMLQA
ncbi:methyltransferase regulatory domain-containing protein [Variovorax dokdonensis]|uniref:Methyltransferase regulatory domain-containing protein n=1 Tax=Variovorax dokdonensis TaxID=344883 RepID=A0ABT7NC64_9BURK|nr:methyltransferase regulatory domain-containing protein [Variovorax dokdonensis]MDM0045516.1 methyltransferase regulatory domain-containing protein [Variovorax dokdonensis]